MIYETDIREFADVRCRIQMRRCIDGSIQQRHIWYRSSAGDYDPPQVDAWIASYTRDPARAFRGMNPSADLDEADELIAALRDIAAGHNDARGRAADALAKAGIT